MAENEQDNDDRTEEASPERRDEFRERGQVAVSREITSVFTLGAAILFFTIATPQLLNNLGRLLITTFEGLSYRRVSKDNILDYARDVWNEVLWVVIPMFLITALVSVLVTFSQTRFNVSFKKLKPDFSRMNIIKGIPKLVSAQAGMELIKGILKMTAVGVVAYAILQSEWKVVPGLMNVAIPSTWAYWSKITLYLFWSVAGLLCLVGGIDYFYNFSSLEKKLKMTKQEVKEEFKRREVDPHLKGRMRRMARDMAMKQALEKTEHATVLIANPTHFSIALQYELGMGAPIVVAKGIDHLALKMREVAREKNIPIIENRPLARELYATVEEGDEIPSKLYTVVAEIIRYVFKLKGRPLSRTQQAE